MHNCNFNKAALLVDVRRMLWKLETYREDAKKADHPLCVEVIDELEADLRKASKKFEDAIAGLAKEGKFTFCDTC